MAVAKTREITETNIGTFKSVAGDRKMTFKIGRIFRKNREVNRSAVSVWMNMHYYTDQDVIHLAQKYICNTLCAWLSYFIDPNYKTQNYILQ